MAAKSLPMIHTHVLIDLEGQLRSAVVFMFVTGKNCEFLNRTPCVDYFFAPLAVGDGC